MSTGETLDDLAALGGSHGTSADDPSGARRAQEAHDAGVVVPPLEVPTFDVHLDFRVHAPEEDARELAQAIAAHLTGHPLILSPLTATVTERV